MNILQHLPRFAFAKNVFHKHPLQVLAVFLLAAFAFPQAVPLTSAAETPYTVQAEGEGATRHTAILQAVKQALMQTEGVNLVAIESMVKDYSSRSVANNDKETSRNVIDDKLREELKTAVAGRLAGYDILSATQNAEGRWTVTINAKLAKYKTPGNSPDSRRKLAVLPFRFHRGDYQLDNTKLNAAGIVERLGQRLVTSFTQSRRFAVVDRDFTSEYLRETSFLKSENAPASELIKIGQALGVDYIIVGGVEEFSGKIYTTRQRLTHRDVTNYEGSAIVSYRILVMATRQIKWSDTIRLDLATLPGETLDARFDTAITEIARQIGEQTLENIYPMKIVDVPTDGSDEVVIGRGGIALVPGERFTVMSTSDRVIIDPDTGEPLGRRETPAALLEITRVDSKLSYAKVIGGSISRLKVGDIVRRGGTLAAPPSSAPREREAAPTPPPVKLPFD